MAGSWQTVTLEEVSDDITVGHVGLMTDQYVVSGVPFLRSLNIEPFTIKTDDLKYIGPEFHSRLKKSALKPGDVVIVRTGKPGACAVVPDWLADANCSDLVIIRPGNRVRPPFLSYVVNSVAQRHIDAHIVGAVQQHFNVGSARTLRFMLPPIGEQDRIVELLGAIQSRIELNRRMAETLEARARALFRSWFVDFDPVRAKAEGRSTGLPEDLAGLFPSSLGEDGLPEGWRSQAAAIGELARSVVNPADVDPTTPYIGLEHLERRKLLIERYGSADHVDSAKTTFRVGDLLFGKLRPYFYKVAVAPLDGICSSDIFVFRPSSGVPRTFLYMSFSQAEFVEGASNASSGTRMPRADWSYMRRLPAVLPPSELLAAFDVSVSPQINAMLARAGQSRTLAALRDTLLPKLISGELRIADAEQRIAAA